MLAGAAYAIDAALGPLTAAFAMGASTLLRGRIAWAVVAGALPAIALHHALNYHVGHVLVPVNMVKEYLLWPGSPFTADKMTGALPPRGAVQTATYALALLVGSRGFFLYNIPTLLVPLSGHPAHGLRAARARAGAGRLVDGAHGGRVAGLRGRVQHLRRVGAIDPVVRAVPGAPLLRHRARAA